MQFESPFYFFYFNVTVEPRPSFHLVKLTAAKPAAFMQALNIFCSDYFSSQNTMHLMNTLIDNALHFIILDKSTFLSEYDVRILSSLSEEYLV